ncbi:MAG: hypothetical protein CMJ50_08845 [Planctomycetaceae bacterium]|nr:hypothetical protein [Planctomycetaceae bacterium]
MQFVELNRSPRGWLRGLRLSSTALLWAPLIYIVNATFDERLSASDTVDEHRDASLWRIVRFIAWLIYLTFQAAQFINFPKFSFDPFPW